MSFNYCINIAYKIGPFSIKAFEMLQLPMFLLSINSSLQFFLFLFLPLSRLNRFNINKKILFFFFFKFAISYSNIPLLLNFFMEKKTCFHINTIYKIGPHSQYTYVDFQTQIASFSILQFSQTPFTHLFALDFTKNNNNNNNR